ncbi:MAG: SpoIIE family protein phosphatase [Bacteroidales bacterium]
MKQIVFNAKQKMSGFRKNELTNPVFSFNELNFQYSQVNFNGNTKAQNCKLGEWVLNLNTYNAKFKNCKVLLVLLLLVYSSLNGQYKHLKIDDPTQRNYLNFYISEQKLNDNYIPFRPGTDTMISYNGKSLPTKKNAAENIYVFRGFFTIDSLLMNEELAFHIGSLNYPCRIFCNGKLIHTLGSYKDQYTSRLRFASGILLSPSLLRLDSINELSIQIYQRFNESTALDKIFISSKKIVDKYTFIRNFFSLNLIQATLLVSVVLAMYFFFLVLFKKGMRNLKYLMFAICCISLGVGYCNISFSFSYANELIIYKISRVSLPVSCLFLIYYTLSSTKIISLNKKSAALLAIPILVFIPFFVISESIYQIEKVFKVYVAFVNIPYLIFAFILGVISFFRRRSKSNFVFVVGFKILIVAVIADTRIYLMDITPYTWGIPHGFLIFTVIIFFILSIEQTKAFNLSIERGVQLQEIKNGLELKVEERTSQLKIQNEKLLVQSKILETANFEISSINNSLLEQKKIVEEKNVELEHQKNLIEEKNVSLNALNEEIIVQRDQLAEQNNSITESIIYAKRIQSAVLPRPEYIDEILPDNFILYLPRNLVSGDFYWIRQINKAVVIAAADCTGHGVPGAIMSMLGISMLNEIVQKREITRPDLILNELRKQVKHALKQTGKSGTVEDGMDIALCSLDMKTNKMLYAGANNSVYLFQNKNLIEIKADRMPIGFYPNEKPTFSCQEIQLKEENILYLFSDGYKDQFGGEKGMKFNTSNFQKLLFEIHEKPMQVQKEKLENEFNSWMKGHEQTDDVLVLGVRI